MAWGLEFLKYLQKSASEGLWGGGGGVVDSSLSYGAEHEYGFKDQDPGSLTQKLCGCSEAGEAGEAGSFVFWKNPQQFLNLLRFKTKINLY